MRLIYLLTNAWQRFNTFFEYLIPFGDLLIRCYVAKIFIYSGLQKISNWSGTLLLFHYEYHVPLLAPDFAAILAVLVEIGISSLLVLGLGGRLPALILFLFNLIALYSYPFLWTKTGYVGFKDHVLWGLLLLVILLHGTGKISLDAIIQYRLKNKNLL